MSSAGHVGPRRAVTVTAMVAVMALVAAMALAVAGYGAGPEHVTLVKTSTGVQLVLPDIADKMGFFAKHGIDASISIVNGDAGSIPAVVSGSVNFGIMTATPFLIANTKGGRLQIVAPLSTYPEQIVMRKVLADRLGITASTPILQKLQAIRNRTVAILDVGGGLQYTLQATLASNGIDPKDVLVVAMSPYTSMLAALQRGAIDVIAPAVPFGQVAVAEGYAVMIADVWGGEVPSIRGNVFTVLSADSEWARAHVQTVQAVRAALQDAMNYLHANPAAVAEFVHQLQPNIPLPVLAAVIGKGAGYPATTTVSRKDFDAMQSFAKLSGANTASVSYSQAVWSNP